MQTYFRILLPDVEVKVFRIICAPCAASYVKELIADPTQCLQCNSVVCFSTIEATWHGLQVSKPKPVWCDGMIPVATSRSHLSYRLVSPIRKVQFVLMQCERNSHGCCGNGFNTLMRHETITESVIHGSGWNTFPSHIRYKHNCSSYSLLTTLGNSWMCSSHLKPSNVNVIHPVCY